MNGVIIKLIKFNVLFLNKKRKKKKKEFNVLGVSMKNQVGNHVGIAEVVN